MTTILIINAVCSLTAGAGLTGFVAWRRRAARQDAQVQPIYVTRR